MLKDKFKLDKFSKTVLIILGFYLVVMLIIFLPKYIKLRKEKLYIITDNYRIKYEFGKWSFNNTDKKEEYTFYENGEYKGKYLALLLDKIRLYDNGSKVNYKGKILGYRGSLKLEVYNIIEDSKLEETDKLAIDKFLEKENIKATYDTLYLQKAILDVDNDGTEETIYCVSNNLDENSQVAFAAIFVSDGDKTDVLVSNSEKAEDKMMLKLYNLENIFDIKKDKKIEILYSTGYSMGSVDEQCYVLHNLSSKKVIHNFCE